MRVAIMNQSEFYDHAFKLQDIVYKIIKTIDSMRNVTTEHRAFMIKSMRNPVYAWYARARNSILGGFDRSEREFFVRFLKSSMKGYLYYYML